MASWASCFFFCWLWIAIKSAIKLLQPMNCSIFNCFLEGEVSNLEGFFTFFEPFLGEATAFGLGAINKESKALALAIILVGPTNTPFFGLYRIHPTDADRDFERILFRGGCFSSTSRSQPAVQICSENPIDSAVDLLVSDFQNLKFRFQNQLRNFRTWNSDSKFYIWKNVSESIAFWILSSDSDNDTVIVALIYAT